MNSFSARPRTRILTSAIATLGFILIPVNSDSSCCGGGLPSSGAAMGGIPDFTKKFDRKRLRVTITPGTVDRQVVVKNQVGTTIATIPVPAGSNTPISQSFKLPPNGNLSVQVELPPGSTSSSSGSGDTSVDTSKESGSGDGSEDKDCPPKCESFELDSSGNPIPPFDREQVQSSESANCGEEPGDGEADNDAEDPTGGGGGGGGNNEPPATLYDSLVDALRGQVGGARIRMSLGGDLPPMLFTVTDLTAAIGGSPSDWREKLFNPLISAGTSKVIYPGVGGICHTPVGTVITEASQNDPNDPFKLIRSIKLINPTRPTSEAVVNVMEHENSMTVTFTDTRKLKDSNGVFQAAIVEEIDGRYVVTNRTPYAQWTFSKVEIGGETWLHVSTTKVVGRNPSQRARSWRFKIHTENGVSMNRMVHEQTGLVEDFIRQDDNISQTYTRGEIVTTPDGIKTGWKAVAFGIPANVPSTPPPAEEGITTVYFGGSDDTAWKWASNGMFEKTIVAPSLLAPQRTTTVLRPWGATASPVTANVSNSHATVTTIQPISGGKVTTEVESINGIETKWTVNTKVSAVTNAGAPIHETRLRYPNGFNSVPLIDYTQRSKRDGFSRTSGRPIHEQRSDGTTVDYAYDETLSDFHAAPNDPNLKVTRTTTTLENIVRQEETIEDGAGRPMETTSSVKFNGVAHPVSAIKHTYSPIDGGIANLKRKNLANPAANEWEIFYSRSFMGSGQLEFIKETDEAGIETIHSNFDAQERPWTTIRPGYSDANGADVPDQKTVRTYDEDGNVTESIVGPDPANPAQEIILRTKSSSYYSDGRLKSETLNGNVTTSYEYESVGAGGQLVKIFRQVGGDESNKVLISETLTDWSGSVSSTSGDAQIPETLSVEVLSSGRRNVRLIKGSGTEVVEERRELDGVDRVVGENIQSVQTNQRTFNYDGFGRLQEERVAGSLTRSWTYNGVLTIVTIHADPDPKRFERHVHEIVQVNGHLWEVYRDGKQETRLRLTGMADGVLNEWQGGPTEMLNRFVTVTASKNGNGSVTESLVRPNATDASTTTSYAGLPVRVKADSQDPAVIHEYDALGRLTKKSELSGGRVTQFQYDPVYGEISVQTTTDTQANLSSVVSNSYYTPDTFQRGRLQTSTTNGIATNYVWSKRGELLAKWGATYPVKYEFDGAGRLSKMHTYQSEPGTNNPATWPVGNVTGWTYFSGTNLLQQKIHAGTLGVSYTYDTRGRTAVRNWARTVNGQPLTATYSYNNAGELRKIDYSDVTPDVTILRNDKGDIITIIDAEGNRNYTRNEDGTIASETLPGLAGAMINYGYDTFGRRHNYSVWDGANWVTWQSWGFDAATGRYSGINTPDGWIPFSYDNQSGLFAGWTVPGGTATGQPKLEISTTRTYDGLGRIVSAQTTNNWGLPVTSRVYGYDNQHRPNTLTDENAEKWTYGYNGRGEVTSGSKSYVNSSGVTQTFPGTSYSYAFDSIGNRTSGGLSSNGLNQYTQKYGNTSAVVLGESAPPPAMLTVTAQGHPSMPPTVSIQRASPPKEKRFAATISNGSSSAPNRNFKITIQENAGGTLTEQVGHLFVPQTVHSFTYDADGNLTQDARWNYKWDAENRLIGMETRGDVTFAGPDPMPILRLSFKYDAFWRRVHKTVEKKNSGGTYDLVLTNRFVYDGCNLIAEWKGEPSDAQLVRTYHWGLDISGSPQGAAGTGGLILIRSMHGSCSPLYDPNNNVVGLIRLSDGIVSANYGYGPFGELVVDTESSSEASPFKWSSKYLDAETGLVYYGYRYYSPQAGRWIGRDPAEEGGGINLYGFVRNAPIENFDAIGLETSSPKVVRPSELQPCSHTFVLGHGSDVGEHIEVWHQQRRHPVGVLYLSGLGCNQDATNGYYGIPGTPNTEGHFIGINDPKSKLYDRVSNLDPKGIDHTPRESAVAFQRLIRDQWYRTLKHASDQAVECPCECDQVTAVFVVLGNKDISNSAAWIYYEARRIAPPSKYFKAVYDAKTLPHLNDKAVPEIPLDGTVINFKCKNKRKN